MDTSFSTTLAPAASPPRFGGAADGAGEVRRLHGHHHHGHERRAERRSERREEREDRGEAFAQLKLKIEQTFTGLPPADSDTDDAEGSVASGGFEAELKMKISVSGPDGRVDARIKLSLEASGDGSAAGSNFAGALQSFTEALFSALKTLYGTAGPQTPVSSAATPLLPAGAPAAVPAPASAPAADPVVVDVPAEAAAPEAAAAPNGAAGSLSIRVRVAYTSFDSQIGPLAQRLAQPGIGNDVPAVGAMFGDLAERFSQLLSAAPNGGNPPPTLASFLAALAQSFAGPRPEAPISLAPAPAPSEASSLSIRFSATARYEPAPGPGLQALAIA